MKRIITTSLLLLTIAAVASRTATAQSEPQTKLVQFQMVLLKRGPNWTAANSASSETRNRHHSFFEELITSGKAVIGGPVTEESELVGLYVLRVKTADEAKAVAAEDPLVKGGYVTAEIHPWWSEEVMKKPILPLKNMTTAYLGLLMRGDKWTPEKTPQTEALQAAHLANIRRLADTKKLVVAGPFGDDGRLRGIFVFKVSSIEEAKGLAATDPAVQAGRLVIDMHSWSVPEGILP